MALDYSCLYVSTNNKTLKPWHPVVNNCYASLFYRYPEEDVEKKDTVFAWIRLDADMPIERANWWLKNIVLPNIPERMRKGIRMWRPFDRSWDRDIPKDVQAQVDYKGKGLVWLKIRIDGNIVSANDLFFLLCWMRTPQEFPWQVNSMYDMHHTLGLPLNQATLLGLAAEVSGAGHALWCSVCMVHWPTKEEIEGFDLKNLWETYHRNKLKVDDDPWYKCSRKGAKTNTTVQKFSKGLVNGPAIRANSDKWGALQNTVKRDGLEMNGIQAKLLDILKGKK